MLRRRRTLSSRGNPTAGDLASSKRNKPLSNDMQKRVDAALKRMQDARKSQTAPSSRSNPSSGEVSQAIENYQNAVTGGNKRQIAAAKKKLKAVQDRLERDMRGSRTMRKKRKSTTRRRKATTTTRRRKATTSRKRKSTTRSRRRNPLISAASNPARKSRKRKAAPKRARSKRTKSGMTRSAKRALGADSMGYGSSYVTIVRGGKAKKIRFVKKGYEGAYRGGKSGRFRSLKGKKNSPKSLDLNSLKKAYNLSVGDKLTERQIRTGLAAWNGHLAKKGGKRKSTTRRRRRNPATSMARRSPRVIRATRNPYTGSAMMLRANEERSMVARVGAGLGGFVVGTAAANFASTGIEKLYDKYVGDDNGKASLTVDSVVHAGVLGGLAYYYTRPSTSEMHKDIAVGTGLGVVTTYVLKNFANKWVAGQSWLKKYMEITAPFDPARRDSEGDPANRYHAASTAHADGYVATGAYISNPYQVGRTMRKRGRSSVGRYLSQNPNHTGAYVSSNPAHAGAYVSSNPAHAGAYVSSTGRYAVGRTTAQPAGRYQVGRYQVGRTTAQPAGRYQVGMMHGNPAEVPADQANVPARRVMTNPVIDANSGQAEGTFTIGAGASQIEALYADLQLIEPLSEMEMREEGINAAGQDNLEKVVRVSADAARQIVENNFGYVLKDSRVIPNTYLIVTAVYDGPQSAVLSDRLRLNTAPLAPTGASYQATGVFTRQVFNSHLPSVDGAPSYQDSPVRIDGDINVMGQSL